jgi:predicted nucleic acid-binding protein
VKLCVPEAESLALLDHVRELERSVSSELTVVETARATVAAVGAEGLSRAEQACARIDLLPVSRSILDRTCTLGPPGLRSLDAIHLATVREPRATPTLAAYDDRRRPSGPRSRTAAWSGSASCGGPSDTSVVGANVGRMIAHLGSDALVGQPGPARAE